MYYIYSYTNKVNGKKYVGQSNNPERRKREHKSIALNLKSKDFNIPFYSAIRKYGWENFHFEVLLKTETPDEDEIRLIAELDSIANGYNILVGGERVLNDLSILSELEATEVREMIKNKVDNKVIKKKFGFSDTLLSNINHGLSYFSEKETYPLRQYYKTKEDYEELLCLLTETDLSFAKIASKLGISISTVKKMNYGKLNRGFSDTYPIRPYKRKPVSTIPEA